MTNAKGNRRTQNNQTKQGQRPSPRAAQSARRRANGNVRTAAAATSLRQTGTRHAINEVITLVKDPEAKGMFTLAPSRASGDSPKTSFDLGTVLGQQALMYNRTQYVAPPKIEWVPMSRMTEGVVVLGFKSSTGVVWPSLLDANNDPEARVGTVDKPLSLSVPLGRLIDAGKPADVGAPQGHFFWFVQSGRDSTSRGEVPVGVIRITASVLMTERQSVTALSEMFQGAALSMSGNEALKQRGG